jgi:hypothetical protein
MRRSLSMTGSPEMRSRTPVPLPEGAGSANIDVVADRAGWFQNRITHRRADGCSRESH